MFPDGMLQFSVTYKCFSVTMLPGVERPDLEKGGKIIMPPSALNTLSQLHVSHAMIFKLINKRCERITHAGVLEFIAEEGKCFLPYWMMDNLLLEEGDFIKIETTSLPVATFSKFQPFCVDFLDITNPKAVLENALRSFACLTTGDIISIKYNTKDYQLCVLETRPENAVSIIECDMVVEFETPFDVKEPTSTLQEQPPVEPVSDCQMAEVAKSFDGFGFRLDGKERKDCQMNAPVTNKKLPRGVPDYSFVFGCIIFDRRVLPITKFKSQSVDNNDKKGDDRFFGEGCCMKKSRD